MARLKGTAHRNKVWPEETTQADLAHYVTREFSNRLVLFLGAEKTQDAEQMAIHAKAMRAVVTRVDQFRRMRVRQWRVPQGLSQTSTSRPASSAQ